ncbi:MAG: hypothetical protein AAF412_02025 [Pseudomonadota bacterium]
MFQQGSGRQFIVKSHSEDIAVKGSWIEDISVTQSEAGLEQTHFLDVPAEGFSEYGQAGRVAANGCKTDTLIDVTALL